MVNTRPRLLFVAPWYLFPATTGGRIRTSDILRGLKGGYFEVTLVSPHSNEPGRDESEMLGICDRFIGWPAQSRGVLWHYGRLIHIFSSLPIPVATERSASAARVLEAEIARRPDLVVYDFTHTAVLAKRHPDIPSIVFTHNIETEIFRRHLEVARNPFLRLLWRNQVAKMDRFEGRSLNTFDGVIAVSERDRDYFKSRYGVNQVFAIPTAVNLNYFKPRGSVPCRAKEPDEGPSIVFTGSMDWLANRDGIEFFMDDIWPLIARECPSASVTIVGRNPPDRLVEKAKRRNLPIEFTGFVDDVRPYVYRAEIYIIPLRVGGGTRLKVFEAMAMDCPVVSTSIGVEGLPLEPDRHYLRGDSPEAFAAAVLRLINRPDLGESLARDARLYVERNFSSERVAKVFEKICADVADLDSSPVAAHMPVTM